MKQNSIPTYVLASLFDVSRAFLLHDFPKANLIQLLHNELNPADQQGTEATSPNVGKLPNLTADSICGNFAQRMLEKRRITTEHGTTESLMLAAAKNFVDFSMSSNEQTSAKLY